MCKVGGPSNIPSSTQTRASSSYGAQVRQQLMDILVQQKIKMTTAGHEWDVVRKAICSAYFQNAAKFKSIGEYVNCRWGVRSWWIAGMV